ncbi:hypothetical protein Xvie_03747 [Xenorhabdus vietnamensis]|uniref:Transposase n=1 Tax=Xenorhabdus vietnamensis TaxID=351656 RepID=A0A1Y2S9L9_9GAMM|nr:transposase [Xenorhabdus vietnamensis]OTA14395.1 hypothetical protein Xvie_03747 [Xenorhabdus vietnamensis]
MRRNRYTPEQKQQHVTQWRHSGLTRKQYCEQHQLNFSSFRDWIADSQKLSQNPNPGLSALLPVALQPAQTHTRSPCRRPTAMSSPARWHYCRR